MKNKRILSFILTFIMVLAAIPSEAFAVGESDFTVVVSMEGLTLGQGMYFEPQAYTLDEINALVAGEGYGPYTEDELTAGIATLAFFIDNGIEYTMTGDWTGGAYISSVKGIDKGYVDIPPVITENGGPSNEENDGNDDEYLGEFDYGTMSGWMITVNDFMIDVGCADWLLTDPDNRGKCPSDLGNTYVVRWQFTLYGYGADLGVDTGWGMPPYFEGASKAPLYAAYAASSNVVKKAAALEVMENLTATQEQVDGALATLRGATDTTEKADYKAILNETMAQLAVTVSEPVFGTGGGEWSVLSLARGGYFPLGDAYFGSYYSRIEETVKTKAASINSSGALHKVKSTENSRLIMALSAIGMDPTDVGGVDLVGAYSANGFSWIKKQGLNGPVFALIALDTKDYATEDPSIRQQCIEYILNAELDGGGWALSGTTADPDMTAMSLQALAKYKDRAEIASVAERGFVTLSSLQQDNGGYASWGSVNSESISQVIVACTAWGIDPDTDSRFAKSGGSALDALLGFYLKDGKGFAHVLENDGGAAVGEVNGMATDQACYALVAYDRYVNGQNALYDMSDAAFPEVELTASLTLPQKVENKAGSAFNAVINLNGFADGYRLTDCVITVPDGVSVTGVTMGSRIGGGNVSYHLDKSTGKLRIVYFDAQNGNTITASGTSFPLEFFTVGLALENTLDAKDVTLAVTGMTFKKSSDSETQILVNTSTAIDSAALVEGVSYSVMTLYTGDDIDLIPSSKTAIALAVTGIAKGARIAYSDATGPVAMRYSRSVSEKTGVSTYIAMIDSDRDLSGFIDENNYTVADGEADTLTFGDLSGDGVINAQDALNSVNIWLRKTEVTADEEILAANVTGDSRINTFDALGIVEYFVDGDEFAVVNRAATVKNTANG